MYLCISVVIYKHALPATAVHICHLESLSVLATLEHQEHSTSYTISDFTNSSRQFSSVHYLKEAVTPLVATLHHYYYSTWNYYTLYMGIVKERLSKLSYFSGGCGKSTHLIGREGGREGAYSVITLDAAELTGQHASEWARQGLCGCGYRTCMHMHK